MCAGEEIEEWELLDLLTALVDKSLVVYEEQRGHGRYRLLETVRQYARDRLVESGEGDRYRSRHRDHFLALAEEARGKLRGSDQALWLNRLEIDHDNLRQALTFCLEDAEGGQQGLRLGAALSQFWLTRGHLSEGRERLSALLNRPGAQDHTKARADALHGAGEPCRRQGDYAAARRLNEESLAIRRELGDQRAVAASLNNLGLVARDQGEHASARSLYEESLEIVRELGDKRGIASALNNMGIAACDQGDFAAARVLYAQSVDITRELGDRQATANSLGNLGIVVCEQGDYASSRPLLQECMEIGRDLGDRRGIVTALEALAMLNMRVEKREQAARLWGAAERIRLEIGLPLPPGELPEHEQRVAEVRAALGEPRFGAAWAEGTAMTMENAIECALGNAR